MEASHSSQSLFSNSPSFLVKKCLDVGSGLILGTAESSDDANPIQIYRCTGKRNQGWVVHQNASVVSNAAPNGCLDLAGGTDYAFPGR